MAEAKVQIKLGMIEFSGEGEEKWVAEQLDKVLAQASDLLRLSLAVGTGKKGGGDDIPPLETNDPLATFLKSKGVGTNQIKRFLATAIWLSGKGSKMLSTGDVTKALRDNLQPKLTNPSDALNKNISKGFCEKAGRQFFVTPDGFASMK
jgi:hypothetical protein